MATVGTEKDLNNLMLKLVEEALESASDRILEIFKNDYVRRIIYNSHGQNKMYMATYEFENAWEWSELKKISNKLSKEMFYNPANMSFDIDSFIHGSRYSRPNDVRGSLMDILNKKGYSSSLWISVKRPLAYWDEFIKNMFSKGELNKILNEELVKRGFRKA